MSLGRLTWERLAAGVQRRPALIVCLLTAATLLSIIGITRLSVSSSLADTVGTAHPAARAMSTIGRRFHAANDVLVLATADTPGPDLERFASDLQSEVAPDGFTVRWQPSREWETWVDAQLMPGALGVLNGPHLDELLKRMFPEAIRDRIRRIEALVAAPGPLAADAAAAAVADPLGVKELLIDQLMPDRAPPGRFLSADGRSLLIRVSTPTGAADTAAGIDLVERVGSAIARIQSDGIETQLTGTPVIAAHSASSIRSDLIRSVIGAVIAVQLLFVVAYRGMRVLFVVILPAGLGTVWAFGVAGIVSGTLTALGAAIGALLVGLGVDYAVHAASNSETQDSGRTTMGRVGPGIVGAAVTTVLAFGVLLSSELEILRGFAAIGGAGLIGAALATFALMPLVLGSGVEARTIALPPVCTRPWTQLVATGVILAGCAATMAMVVSSGGRLLPRDNDLRALHPAPNPPLDVQHLVDARFSGPDEGLPILIEPPSRYLLPDMSHRVRQALTTSGDDAWQVIGLDAIVPPRGVLELGVARLGFYESDRVVADLRAAIDESFLSPEALEVGLQRTHRMLRDPRRPSINDLRAYPDLARSFLPIDDGSPAGLVLVQLDATLDHRSTRREMFNEIRRRLADIPGATLTGLPVLGDEAEQLVAREFPRLAGLAGIAVLVWLIVYLRSFVDVLLVLLPTLFGCVFLLALVPVLGVHLNVVNLAALPLLIGIGMDDGIFLVTAARGARGGPPGELKQRLDHESHAIVVTSLTTILAFGSLALTSTPAIRSFGLLVAIGVIACLWGSLLLLAPILHLRAGRESAS